MLNCQTPALINWSDNEKKQVEIALTEELLGKLYDEEGEYAVCDFYSGEYYLKKKAGETVCFQELEPHGATIVKVERIKDKPIVVASDNHYSMGLEVERMEMARGELCFEYKHGFMCPVTFKVWVPGVDEMIVYQCRGEE